MTHRALRTTAVLAAVASFSAWADDRTIRLSNPPNEQGFQELATVLRTVGQIRTVSFDSAKALFTYEGDASQLALCAWLLRAMDKPIDWKPSDQERNNPAVRQLRPAPGADDVIRVWYLRSAGSPRDVQEMLTILRTVADVRMVFNYSPLRVLALRGTEATMDMADWLLAKMDLSSGEGASEVYAGKGAPGDLAQVFYLKPGSTGEELKSLLTELRRVGRVYKVFDRSTPPMMVVRGGPAELAKTREIIAAGKY